MMLPITAELFITLGDDMRMNFTQVDPHEDLSDRIDNILLMIERGDGGLFMDFENVRTFMQLDRWVQRGIILYALANAQA